MSSKKIITVFGATGNQGGSIVSEWLSHPELKEKYTVRAVTRDTSKPAAQKLKSEGAEVVSADLNDPSSLKHAVEGAYGVYALTNYWEFLDKAKELAQGKAIADAVFATGVKHFVWSSLPHTTKLTEGKLSQIDHFVAKAEVEEYIEQNKSKSGTMASYYMPAFYMPNFAQGFINPGQDGTPTFAAPYGPNAKHPLIDPKADTGKWVWGILEQGQAADGKQVQAVGDWLTSQEIADLFTEYSGQKVVFAQLPREMFKGFLEQKFKSEYTAEEMTQNMDLIADYSYYGKGSEAKQAENDKFLLKGSKVTTLKEYIEANKPWKFGGQ